MGIKLSNENRELIIRKIQDFYISERDEEIGAIGAESILNFFIDELSGNLYNQALLDAKSFFLNKMEDLEADFEALYK